MFTCARLDAFLGDYPLLSCVCTYTELISLCAVWYGIRSEKKVDDVCVGLIDFELTTVDPHACFYPGGTMENIFFGVQPKFIILSLIKRTRLMR